MRTLNDGNGVLNLKISNHPTNRLKCACGIHLKEQNKALCKLNNVHQSE